MAQIVQSFLGGDQRLQLGGEEFVRTMAFGNYWTKIRILIRASINGTSSIASNVFVTGVCEGTQSTFVTPGTRFYVGGYWNNFQTVTYINTAQPYYVLGGGNTNSSVIRVNGVETNVAGSYSSSPLMCAAFTGFTNVIGFDITRNNLSYTMIGWAIGTQAALQIPRSTYSTLYDAENEAGGPFNTSGNIWSSRTQSVSSGSNQLDTISIYWNNPAIPLEISDIVVCRYY